MILRRRFPLAALLASLALLAGCSTAPPVAPSANAPAPLPSPQQRLAELKARQARELGVPIIELRGGPADLGRQHGEALQAPINTLHDTYVKRFIKTELVHQFAIILSNNFLPFLDADRIAELKALAASSGRTMDDTLFATTFLDLMPFAACSTLTLPAAAAPDHVARFARNLDFASFQIADKYTTLVIFHPAGRYAFAAVTWPGLIGVLSGMNEHGLCIANMEVHRAKRMPSAMPYTLLYRTLLERCKTVDEALDLLKSTPRQSTNNLMLMDAAGHRAVAEITPEAVTIRTAADDAPLISTNHQRAQDADTAGRCWRYDRLHASVTADFGAIGVDTLESYLASVAQGDFTMQSMVFEPSTRRLYLAAGLDAPQKAQFHAVDLAPYFQPDPPQSAGP